MKTALIALILSLFMIEAQAAGIKGKKAPEWQVDQWHNLPKGKTQIKLSDYKEKIVYLYCFQSWCPGCHSSGLPTLKKAIKKYSGNKDIVFIAVQTTFEGFHTNTFSQAKKVAKKYSLKIPVGQSGTRNKKSALMKIYQTGGTPWTIIIGKNGKVKANKFHFNMKEISKIIDKELGE